MCWPRSLLKSGATVEEAEGFETEAPEDTLSRFFIFKPLVVGKDHKPLYSMQRITINYLF